MKTSENNCLGTSVADPLLLGVDPDPDLDPQIHALTNGSGFGSDPDEDSDPDADLDPDPAIFVIDPQDANKEN
jgi:hypothetical protein